MIKKEHVSVLLIDNSLSNRGKWLWWWRILGKISGLYFIITAQSACRHMCLQSKYTYINIIQYHASRIIRVWLRFLYSVHVFEAFYPRRGCDVYIFESVIQSNLCIAPRKSRKSNFVCKLVYLLTPSPIAILSGGQLYDILHSQVQPNSLACTIRESTSHIISYSQISSTMA